MPLRTSSLALLLSAALFSTTLCAAEKSAQPEPTPGDCPALVSYMKRMYERPRAPMRIAQAMKSVGLQGARVAELARFAGRLSEVRRSISIAGTALLLAQLAALQAAASEPSTWSFEVLVGDAHNFDSRTHIERPQLGAVSLDGDYETRGLEGPLHYAWRIARWRENRGWELQLLHHKLYLRNLPPAVDALSVSHGFNIVTLNRAFEFDGWRLRIGLGPIVAHPEARISGVSYNGQYELCGAAAIAGIGRSLALTRKLYLSGDLAATLGYMKAHPDGSPNLEFSILNPAVHAQLGVGYRF